MKLRNIFFVTSALLALTSCTDLFEPALENKQDISQMFKDKEFARGILGSAYLQLPYAGNTESDVATDDAVTSAIANKSGEDYRNTLYNRQQMAKGGWAANNDPMSQWQGRYNAIQYCNIMLENVEAVEWATEPVLNNLYIRHFKGNSYAMRALQFFYLLREHAGFATNGELLGAPIHTASEDGGSDFNQHRAPFKECIDQIFADLDAADELLPFTYGNVGQNDPVLQKLGCTNGQYNRAFGDNMIGKIDGKIIAAVRAQVALFAASPAYQSAGAASWQQAAEYAGQLLTKLGGVQGMDKEGWKWYTLTNEGKTTIRVTNEIIWRDNIGENNDVEKNNFPPSLEGLGAVNPSQNLVDAFPMANGYPITDKENSGYDASRPYENRDPRLAAYVLCDGAKISNNEDYVLNTGTYEDGNIDGLNKDTNNRATRTGYYMHKFMRDMIGLTSGKETKLEHYNARIRATEIFLAYAEAANEAGGPTATYGGASFSAYDVVKALRQRAGIGDGDKYLESIKGDTNKMRDLIRNERRLELCFENQRFFDLRRWNALDKLNETVTGIEITAKNADGSIVYKPINVETRDYKDYMIYGPIPYGETMKWSNLEQNKGW